MNAYSNKAILLLLLLLSFQGFSQESLKKRLDSARISLISNPKYSYETFSEISKDAKHHDSIRGVAYLYLGAYFNSTTVLDSTLYYAKKSLPLLHRNEEVAVAYRIMGSAYRMSGNIDEAIKLLHKGLEISSSSTLNRGATSQIKADLGILYANKKDYPNSLKFFKESIESAVNKQAVYGNYVNIGSIYFLQGDKQLAKEYFLQALELLPKGRDPNTESTVKLNLGILFFEEKKYKEAASYFDESKTIADRYELQDKSLKVLANKALLVDAMGDSTQAIATLKDVSVSAKAINNLEIQKLVYENLTEVYENNNDYKSAHASSIEFHKLKDSLQNKKQKKEITELEVKYETAEKEKEILVLKEDQLVKDNEISKQRLLKKTYVIGFIAILIPVIALLIVYYQKLKVKNKYNQQKEEAHKQRINAILKEQELMLSTTYTKAQNEERGRIARELHDSVGGNLAAIKLQMMGAEQEYQIKSALVDQVNEVYEQVRTISHNLTPRGLNDTSFTKYVGDYISTIEKVTDPEITFAPHPVDKVNTIDENHKVEIFKIIQELLTNALKHARAKVIEVCLNVYNDTIEIIFEDDGVGFDTKKGAKGIGLQNVNERLSMLSARMDIDSAINRGTAIRIKIPIEDDDKEHV